MVGRFGLSGLVEKLRIRHFWRKATFSEISALYIAKVLRLMALNLVSAFILIYLYKSGHTLLYLAIFTAFRALVAVLATPIGAMLTAQFGAKKIILISNLLYIPAVICYTNLQDDVAIILGGALQSIGVTLYQVAHDVIFSEIKSDQNAGKEISYMAIFEKVTNILSPLLGGIMAAFFSPTVVIVLASILFVVSTWPLFRTQNTAKKHHQFKLEAVPFRVYWREMLCQIGPGFDSTVDKVWSVFLVLAIFSQQDSYLVTGLANSVAGVVAVLGAFWAGKMLDKSRKHGLLVFDLSVFLGSASHVAKAFVRTPLGAFVDIVATGLTSVTKDMSSLRAQFLRADNSGSRVAYLMYRHLFWNFFTFVSSLIWVALSFYGDATTGMNSFFIIAGIASLFYTFSGYWSKRHN